MGPIETGARRTLAEHGRPKPTSDLDFDLILLARALDGFANGELAPKELAALNREYRLTRVEALNQNPPEVDRIGALMDAQD